jgi:exonuclease VII large subunit
VLKRGFAVVRDEKGQIVSKAAQVETGQALKIELDQGKLKARVE